MLKAPILANFEAKSAAICIYLHKIRIFAPNTKQMPSFDQIRQDIDQYFQESLDIQQSPQRLYAPIQYILALKGKRVRALLTQLAYQAVSGEKPQNALKLGAALEMFHNFTLVHDDIMDNAPVRRGKATVHEKWDANVAILSGDTMFALAMQWVVESFPQYAGQLAVAFTKAAIAVCEGQMEDMDFALTQKVSIPQYIEMIRKKTAVLMGASLQIGALAGGADAVLSQKIYRFGELAGIAFQLQDDLMDAYPPTHFGKQIGGDIIENKKTFLLLTALETANEGQLNLLHDLLHLETNPAQKVAKVLEIYEALQIRTQTEKAIEGYFGQARQVGKELMAEIPQQRFEVIAEYLEEIAGRKV